MRLLLAGFVFTVAAIAAKPVSPATAEDEAVLIEAVAHTDKAGVTAALGRDPGMELLVIHVKFAPRGETKIRIDIDDFTLLSRKDGQRSQPLAPSQIAGTGALVVTPGRSGGGGMGNPRRGPIWGGVPGTGDRPRRVGGDQDIGAVAGPTGPQASVTDRANQGDNPLMETLKEKMLPQRETNEPVVGLLYFFLEGKHKLKDLELMYKSPVSRMMLDFER